jgi:small subunit ribosomal protein S7
VRFNSVQIASFINRVMKRGKKSVATTLVYDAMAQIEERTKKNPMEVFEQALRNVSPVMEVKTAPGGWCNLSGSDGSCAGPPVMRWPPAGS